MLHDDKHKHTYSLQVKSAEAEAEAKYLSGVGVAKQRKAIVDGLRTSIVVSVYAGGISLIATDYHGFTN